MVMCLGASASAGLLLPKLPLLPQLPSEGAGWALNGEILIFKLVFLLTTMNECPLRHYGVHGQTRV